MMSRIILTCLMAVVWVQTQALTVTFDYRVFHSPVDGPYAEFYTSFDGRTLVMAPASGELWKVKAQVTIIVSQNGKIIDFRKSEVESPEVQKGESVDMMSVERFLVPRGSYDLELEIIDLNNPESTPTIYTQKIEINNPSTGVFISDIEFVSAYRQTTEPTHFTKAGYDVMPYNSNYYPTSLNSLVFYAEIYGTEEVYGNSNAFVSNVCIIDANENALENCKKIKREKAAQVVPMLHSIDISDLPTGSYKIRIEVRDRENVLVSLKERNFTRNKVAEMDPATRIASDAELAGSFAARFTDRDELYAHILYHLPIANDIDRNTIDNQLEVADLLTLQSFLYSFWYKRDSANPEGAWSKYNESIQIVKDNFETKIKPGWLTDRGRVYLQYGKPNTRIVRPSDPDYWPFEIWHYYVTDGNLHNRRFLFYDTNLSGDMELLHSDVPGEIKNFFWKDMVKTRPAALNMGDGSGNNASQRTDPNSRDEIENLWYSPH